MINTHVQIVNPLTTILPTYHELALTSGLSTPCISYQEINNYMAETGDKLGYSRITYQIKVWGYDIEELQQYAQKIDTALRTRGFKRISSGELYDRNSTMIQKILTYEALASETY